MLFQEVSNKEFNMLHDNKERCEPGVIYGSSFKYDYEVLDYNDEHATFSFKTEEEAKAFVTEKYNMDGLNTQMDLFQMM